MTREIPLTKGYVALVDDEDFAELSAVKWCALECRHTVYAVRADGSGREFMHRRIAGDPIGLDVDHADRDGLNNRRRNLRPCTRAQNVFNRSGSRTNPTGFKGVSKHRKRYVARLKFEGQHIRVGSFATPEEAAAAYDEEALARFGEFAWLNFPERRRSAVGGVVESEERRFEGVDRSEVEQDLFASRDHARSSNGAAP